MRGDGILVITPCTETTKGPSRIVIIFIYDNYYRKRGEGVKK